ncbi:MAG: hypothetical protein ABI158_02305 [Edaphobacter sp.]
MMRLDLALTPALLKTQLEHVFELSAAKIHSLAHSWESANGSPVITVRGVYTTRAWADWTQGFQFGSALLQFDATGDPWFLDHGRRNTLAEMPKHLTNIGGHDHGFNIISTYGNLLRMACEGKIAADGYEAEYYRLALKTSGAVQAARWTSLPDGGYIHSFHGPHSLFVDAMRSLRSLGAAHRLGHVLMGEGDKRISLLERLVQHASVTAKYAIFYGEGRDHYDVRGRVAHEAIFNVTNGTYRCATTQQGFSPFTTWTRGLAWAMLGFAEQLEFLATLSSEELDPLGGRSTIETMLRRAAEATCDYYIEQTPSDGVPYWDTAAPDLTKLDGYRDRPSDPYNNYEPVDSSAASAAAQGLWRLGTYLKRTSGASVQSERYRQAALVIAHTLFEQPYLSEDAAHQGLILHAIYNRPGGWDYVAPGHKVPCGESTMWGDYHALELALLLLRDLRKEAYPTYFAIC